MRITKGTLTDAVRLFAQRARYYEHRRDAVDLWAYLYKGRTVASVAERDRISPQAVRQRFRRLLAVLARQAVKEGLPFPPNLVGDNAGSLWMARIVAAHEAPGPEPILVLPAEEDPLKVAQRQVEELRDRLAKVTRDRDQLRAMLEDVRKALWQEDRSARAA